MLRIYMIQNLYNLSDMATVAEVIDSRAFSDFCGVESSNQVPGGDTLTKNKDKKRDPEAHSAKKGSIWHFGYKAHVGFDHETGIVHSLEV